MNINIKISLNSYHIATLYLGETKSVFPDPGHSHFTPEKILPYCPLGNSCVLTLACDR